MKRSLKLGMPGMALLEAVLDTIPSVKERVTHAALVAF